MFTLEKVNSLLAQNLADEFRKNESAFISARDAAIDEIKEYIEIDEAEPFPDSLLSIAAWLMNMIGLGKFTTVPEHDRIRFLKMYDLAIERLKKLSGKSTTHAAFKLEVMEW